MKSDRSHYITGNHPLSEHSFIEIVYAVVDLFKKAKITFKSHCSWGDTIKRGFLKAKIVDDPLKMNIHADNKMVIEPIDHIKKKFVKLMGIISAMKRISKVDISQK